MAVPTGTETAQGDVMRGILVADRKRLLVALLVLVVGQSTLVAAQEEFCEAVPGLTMPGVLTLGGVLLLTGLVALYRTSVGRGGNALPPRSVISLIVVGLLTFGLLPSVPVVAVVSTGPSACYAGENVNTSLTCTHDEFGTPLVGKFQCYRKAEYYEVRVRPSPGSTPTPHADTTYQGRIECPAGSGNFVVTCPATTTQCIEKELNVTTSAAAVGGSDASGFATASNTNNPGGRYLAEFVSKRC